MVEFGRKLMEIARFVNKDVKIYLLNLITHFAEDRIILFIHCEVFKFQLFKLFVVFLLFFLNQKNSALAKCQLGESSGKVNL